MMINYFAYQDNGKIIQTGTCQESELPAYAEALGVSVVAGQADWRTDYAPQGIVVPRPVQETTLSNNSVITNGSDEGVLTHLPIPCIVTIEETPYRVEDGVLEFTLPLPGLYLIRVTDCFPYLDKEFTCEGIAPV